MMKAVFLLAVVAVALAHEGCEHGEVIKRAVVVLEAKNVHGTVIFAQQEDGKLHITGKVTGMPPGEYGFHVHEKGDLSEGCGSAKAHFNPDGKDHGHPEDENRHAGDLGNIVFDASGVANVDIVDSQVKLMGPHNIIGRALVLHAAKDDFGRTDHPDSKKTGNAGARVACGVIGIMDTIRPVTGSRVGANDVSTTAVHSVLILISVLQYITVA